MLNVLTVAPKVHMFRIQTYTVQGMPLVMSGFNGKYDLDWNQKDEPVYKRRHGTMLLGAIALRPSYLKFNKLMGHWEIISRDNRPFRQRRDTAYFEFACSPEGEYLLRDGTPSSIKVTALIHKPSLKASVAFPHPKLPRREYEPLQNREGFVVLRASWCLRIPAVHYKYTGPGKLPFTILYSHGNCEDVLTCDARCQNMMQNLCCDVLSYDYIGYSTSAFEGHCPSVSGCLESIWSAYNYLTHICDVSPKNIILYGRSIGTGPTCDLAARPACRDCIGGVVLECGMLSAFKALTTKFAWMARPFDFFINKKKIKKINRPVTIIHGKNDSIVAYNHGVTLTNLAKKPYKMLTVDAGHNDLPYDTCDKHTKEFVKHVHDINNNV